MDKKNDSSTTTKQSQQNSRIQSGLSNYGSLPGSQQNVATSQQHQQQQHTAADSSGYIELLPVQGSGRAGGGGEADNSSSRSDNQSSSSSSNGHSLSGPSLSATTSAAAMAHSVVHHPPPAGPGPPPSTTSSEWNVPAATAGASSIECDNQQAESSPSSASTSCVGLPQALAATAAMKHSGHHRQLQSVLSKPVYTATSTPEIRTAASGDASLPPVGLHHPSEHRSRNMVGMPVLESVNTCPTLLNSPLMTPPIKIHIHRAPNTSPTPPNTTTTTFPPTTIASSSASPLPSPSSASVSSSRQALPQGGGPMFIVSSGASSGLTPSSSLSKSHPGTVAAKLGRRRASSNAASSSAGGGSGGPHSSSMMLSTNMPPPFGPPGSINRRKSWDQRVAGPIRRASQALINLASASGVLSGVESTSMGSVFGSGSGLYGECSRRDSRIRMPEIMLMYSSFQRVPMKDFGAEVRASMDVDQFLQQAVLLLDITETSLEGIVDRMLRKVRRE